MNKLHLLLSLLIIFVSCTDKKQTNINNLWTIDVTKEYPTKDIYLQDIADVEYIPLETNDSILWVGREIRYMDENCIVGGIGSNGVYFHDRTGKVQHSFQRKGPGPEEYTGFTLMKYDKESDEVLILAFDGKYIVYDSKGNFKRSFNPAAFQIRYETPIE